MVAKTVNKPVKGGVIARSATSGRLLSVQSGSKVTKSTEKTTKTVEIVSSRRRDALARLVDR